MLKEKLREVIVRIKKAGEKTLEDYRVAGRYFDEARREGNYYEKRAAKSREMFGYLSFPLQFLSRCFERDFWNADRIREAEIIRSRITRNN